MSDEYRVFRNANMGSDTKIQELTDQLLEYKSALQVSNSDLNDANQKIIVQEAQIERLT